MASGEIKEKVEFQSDSEYHTGSEFQPEFHSDNEPPQDKVAEAKLIVKHKDVRVYKKIIKIGMGSFMPAKYDKIFYRIAETPTEILSAVPLDGIQFQHGQMGITVLDEELIYCLEHMRQGEISAFKIEHVTYTEKKKRILLSERFLVSEMKSWETIIDVTGDMSCMKHVKIRGIGQKRFSILDEVSFKATLYQEEPHKVFRDYDVQSKIISTVNPKLPTILIEMLKSGKAQEKFTVTCEYEYVKECEQNQDFLSELNPDRDLLIDVHLESIVELIDLCRDGTVMKKVTKQSYTSTAPDENSAIYFDYKVFDREDHLIYTSRQG